MNKMLPGQQPTSKQRKQTQPLEGGRPIASSTIRSLVGRGVSNVLTVIGGVAALLSFLPLFSVSNEPLLDPADPFSARLVVEYDGLIPIADVKSRCIIDHLEDSRRVTLNGIWAEMDYGALRMTHGDALTLPCALPITRTLVPLVSASITIKVDYRPILVPRRIAMWLRNSQGWWRKDFNFVAENNSKGECVWMRQPELPN